MITNTTYDTAYSANIAHSGYPEKNDSYDNYSKPGTTYSSQQGTGTGSTNAAAQSAFGSTALSHALVNTGPGNTGAYTPNSLGYTNAGSTTGMANTDAFSANSTTCTVDTGAYSTNAAYSRSGPMTGFVPTDLGSNTATGSYSAYAAAYSAYSSTVSSRNPASSSQTDTLSTTSGTSSGTNPPAPSIKENSALDKKDPASKFHYRNTRLLMALWFDIALFSLHIVRRKCSNFV